MWAVFGWVKWTGSSNQSNRQIDAQHDRSITMMSKRKQGWKRWCSTDEQVVGFEQLNGLNERTERRSGLKKWGRDTESLSGVVDFGLSRATTGSTVRLRWRFFEKDVPSCSLTLTLWQFRLWSWCLVRQWSASWRQDGRWKCGRQSVGKWQSQIVRPRRRFVFRTVKVRIKGTSKVKTTTTIITHRHTFKTSPLYKEEVNRREKKRDDICGRWHWVSRIRDEDRDEWVLHSDVSEQHWKAANRTKRASATYFKWKWWELNDDDDDGDDDSDEIFSSDEHKIQQTTTNQVQETE